MSFQAIEDGVSTDGELFVAGLAEQILNVFILAMVTICRQDMDGLLSDKIVGAGAGLEQYFCATYLLSKKEKVSL